MSLSQTVSFLRIEFLFHFLFPFVKCSAILNCLLALKILTNILPNICSRITCGPFRIILSTWLAWKIQGLTWKGAFYFFSFLEEISKTNQELRALLICIKRTQTIYLSENIILARKQWAQIQAQEKAIPSFNICFGFVSY